MHQDRHLKKKTHVKSNKESKAMADLTIVEKQEEGERKIYQRSKSQLQCFSILRDALRSPFRYFEYLYTYLPI